LGIPCLLTMCYTNSLDSTSLPSVFLHGTKVTHFENRSTNENTALYPYEVTGKPVTRSILTYSKRWLGTGSGYARPRYRVVRSFYF
jgi:hypothetical protein